MTFSLSTRSRAVLAALLCMAVLVACSDSTSLTQPTRIPAPNREATALVTPGVLDGPNAGSAQLATGAYSDKLILTIPTQFHVQNPCAGGRFGEIVVFQGNQHLVFTQTSTENGHLSTMLHWGAEDVVGIGQYTGFQYRATGVTQDKAVSDATLPYTETMINNYHIIGSGQATDMDLHETVHVTVDANGLVTAWVTDYDFQCHGTPTF